MSNRRNETQSLEEAAIAQGWTVRRTSRGHTQFIPADKRREIVVAAGTTGDWRRMRRLQSNLRNSGLVIP